MGGGKRGQNAVRMVQQITSSMCDSEIINLSSIMLGKQRGQRRAGAAWWRRLLRKNGNRRKSGSQASSRRRQLRERHHLIALPRESPGCHLLFVICGGARDVTRVNAEHCSSSSSSSSSSHRACVASVCESSPYWAPNGLILPS